MTTQETKNKTVHTGKMFYYPYNGRWYRYIDTFIDGKLLSRVCREDASDNLGDAIEQISNAA